MKRQSKAYLFYSLVLLTVVAMVSSCGPSAAEKEAARKRRALTPNPIEWDTTKLEVSQPLSYKAVSALCKINVNFISPRAYQSEGIKSSLQDELSNFVFNVDNEDPTIFESQQVNDIINRFTSNYIDGYTQNTKEAIDIWNKIGNGDSLFSTNLNLDTRILYNEANFISYQVDISEYRGNTKIESAPHFVINTVYDLAEGVVLTEKDIFSDGYEDFIHKIIIKKLLYSLDLETIDDLQVAGYWGITDMTANGNFYLTRDGITYSFNPAGYADKDKGIINIFIDFDELVPILKENSPISVLTKDEEKQ